MGRNVRARCFGASSLPSTNASKIITPQGRRSVHSFAILQLFTHGFKVPCIRSTPTAMQSMSENDFECFASTGVNTPETTFPNSVA